MKENEPMKKTICALGFFDGVHLGHGALLAACRALAEEENCDASVVTFASHPDELVFGAAPRLINTSYDREKLLKERFSMDTVVTLPFDAHMKAVDWRDFLAMLERDYGALGFVCGEDFRFGALGAGTAESLSRYCWEKELRCAVVPEQTVDGIRVSSTYIRRQLETGDMATAVRFPHSLRHRSAGAPAGKKAGHPHGEPASAP